MCSSVGQAAPQRHPLPYTCRRCRWDWAQLKARIAQHGLRNSLLVALMPTASTSKILGNVECFEPLISNVSTLRLPTGEIPLVNRYLVSDLVKLGRWNEVCVA